MLKKKERISKKKEFEEIKAKGKLVATPMLGLIYSEEEGIEGRKFGVVVSKKISKKAVERNQIRRRLMEAVRKNIDIFPANFRGIFLVKKNILGKKTEEIEKCLKMLF